MGKGQQNERDLCKQFSLWWSEGLGISPPRDDIFWRTAGSGARARVRIDAGKETHQGYGDMMAEDPIGQPLIDACTFEFKKGYDALSLLDCIASRQRKPLLIQFVQSVEKDAQDAHNWPILVFQKKRRKAIICMKIQLYLNLQKYFGKSGADTWRLHHKDIEGDYVLMRLTDFFDWARTGYFTRFASTRNTWLERRRK